MIGKIIFVIVIIALGWYIVTHPDIAQQYKTFTQTRNLVQQQTDPFVSSALNHLANSNLNKTIPAIIGNITKVYKP